MFLAYRGGEKNTRDEQVEIKEFGQPYQILLPLFFIGKKKKSYHSVPLLFPFLGKYSYDLPSDSHGPYICLLI